MSTQNKIPATVRVFTLNCARTLERCLESLQDFEEILVLDGNSTDDTLDIARKYGARIEKQFPGTDKPTIIKDWPELVNRALKMARFEWVLYIDSDESASLGLVEEIRRIVTKHQIDHYTYQTPNRIIYNNREILYATAYPGYQYRFINRTSGAWYEGNPHYFLKFDKQKYAPGVLKNPWYVYVDDSDAKTKKLQVLQDALDAKNQNWKQFIKWSIANKLLGITKVLLKVTFLYIRHGFKDTLPPKLELARVKYKSLLFGYIIGQKFFGRSLESDIAKEKKLLENRR